MYICVKEIQLCRSCNKATSPVCGNKTQRILCFLCQTRAETPATSRNGNTEAISSPNDNPSPDNDESQPTKAGPPPHPKSPANANKANITVPPAGKIRAPRLNVPGHIIPTENPHNPQPHNDNSGCGAKTASR